MKYELVKSCTETREDMFNEDPTNARMSVKCAELILTYKKQHLNTNTENSTLMQVIISTRNSTSHSQTVDQTCNVN